MTPQSPPQTRDLALERHLLGIGAGVQVAGITLALLSLAAPWALQDASVNPWAIATCVAILGFLIWRLGTSLRNLNDTARKIALVWAVLQLLSLPRRMMRTLASPAAHAHTATMLPVFALVGVATLLAIVILYRTSTICTEEYRNLVAQTPMVRVRFYDSPFFWLLASMCLYMTGGLMYLWELARNH